MKFLQSLIRRIFPEQEGACNTPSQHLLCPYCNTKFANQTEFEQEHATFEEGTDALAWNYTCGHCSTVSQWFVGAAVPVLMGVRSYGVPLAQLRFDIQEHFRTWMPEKYTQQNVLRYAAKRLAARSIDMQCLDMLNDPEICYMACAVDYIIYALLISEDASVCVNMNRLTMQASTTEIETYLSTQLDALPTLLKTADKYIRNLHDTQESSKNVPYIFIRPIVESCAPEIFRIGVLMLQLRNLNHFHNLVYERLRHFVYMSA